MSTESLAALAVRMQRLTYMFIRSYERCDQWVIAPHDLTISQGYTLLALHPQETINMSELSRSMELANSTMTRMVDQLVNKGLVQREPDEIDRRVILVRLTPRGQEVQSTLRQEFLEFFTLVLQEIEQDERSTVIEALEKLVGAIERAIISCELE